MANHYGELRITDDLIFNASAIDTIIQVGAPAGNITVTLPSVTGTLALVDDLGSYLPIAGGTLTGNLRVNAQIGIGTAPIFDLDIASATDVQIRQTRSGGATLHSNVQATRAYLGTSSAHDFELIAGNSAALSIDGTSKNIGIGTAPNASYKLGVNGLTYGVYATANSGSTSTTYGINGYAAATGADNYGIIGEARTANSGPSGTNGTNGRNAGVVGVAYAATGASSHNIGVYGAINSINQLGGANEVALYGFVGNGAGSPTTSHGMYLQNNQTNTANKYGGRITLANDQASGIGYGLHILQASTFTAGTAYGLDIDHSGTTPTKYGARLVVNGTSTTNYGLYIDSSAATTNYGVVVQNGTSIFNEGGGDYDFRVEGDTAINLLKVDAGLDSVGINEGTPDGKLHVSSFDRGCGRTCAGRYDRRQRSRITPEVYEARRSFYHGYGYINNRNDRNGCIRR